MSAIPAHNRAASPAAAAGIAPWSARDVRLAFGIAAAVTVLYGVVGAVLHPSGYLYGETDAYVARAVAMHTGEGTTSDPFHPYGVPLGIFLLARTGIAPFAAGRLLSALGAGLLAAAVWGLGRVWCDRRAAALLTAAATASELVFVQAQLAASEMLSTGLLGVGLWCWVRAADSTADLPADRHRLVRVAAGGLFAGLAAATRTPVVMALPAALALLPRPWRAPRRAAATAAIAAAGFAIGLLPDVLARAIWGAAPERTGALNTLVLKYRHGLDWDTFAWSDYSHLTPMQSLALLAEGWPNHLAVWLRDACSMFAGTLGQLVSVRSPWAAAAISAAMTLAIALALVRGPLPRRVLALAAIGYGLGLALVFVPDGRYLLPMLPAVLPLAASLLHGHRRGGAWSRTVSLAALLTTAAMLPGVVRTFELQHGAPEVAAARELVAREGRPLVLLCNFDASIELADALFLLRQDVLRQAPGPGGIWPALLEQADRQLIDYVLLDQQRDRDLIARLRADLPAQCEVVRDDQLFALRLPHHPGAEALLTTVADDGDGRVVRVQAPAGTRIALASFRLRQPLGRWSMPAGELGADGATFTLRVPRSQALPSGSWTLFPWCVTADLRLLRGPPIELQR